MKTAAIIVVGNEILSGKCDDENAKFLISELRTLGVRLMRVTVIPDDLEIIAETVRDLHRRVDHLFTSGGVGPTHDDLTVEGVARGLGRGVTRDPVLERRMRGRFGAELPEAALRMADVPEGTQLLATDSLQWPVCCVDNVYVMPGVPEIFRTKFQAIRERFRQPPFVMRTVHLRAEESRIAHELAEVASHFPNVDIGSYPGKDAEGWVVRITIEGKDEGAVAGAATRLAERMPPGLIFRTE